MVAPLAVAAMSAAATVAAGAPADAGTAGSVVNGGFEADGTGTATPAGWTTHQWRGTGNASYTEAGGHSGGYRLSHWSSAAYAVTTSQRINGLTGGDYTLTAWVRSGGGQSSVSIGLADCGGPDKSTAVPTTADGQWVRIVVSTKVAGGHCTLELTSDANAGNWANFDDVTFAPGYAGLPIRGGDVSSLQRGEELGGVYYTADGREEDALTILGNAGMDYARLRVWVNPVDGFDDEAQMLAMAKQVKAHHMKLLLDLHYSDTWADPGKQYIPAAWANDTLPQLEAQVRAYSFQITKDLVKQGTAPDMVQTGNEINSGILWPYGKTWGPDSSWTQAADLVKAGIEGVKAARPQTRIMLHIADGADDGGARWWFDNAVAQGIPFDVIGLSYYSYWHGPLDQLQYTLDDMAARYGKPVVVAETAAPWTMANADNETNSVTADNTTLDAGYPATPQGQAAQFRDVQSIVQAVPGGMGLGAFYWEPTWTAVPGNGWDPADPASGDGWENQAVFDFSDKALPAVAEFRER
jgi:arabinogalactan endo-1,4-beta-galactosidase